MSGNDGQERRLGGDRRVRRTRHALRHALVELVLEKGYDRVTVEDVIARADVGRSTFYAHYRDKEDLFLSSFEDEVREAFERSSGADGGSASLWLFRHAAEHADLYRALVKRRGGWALVRRHLEGVLRDLFARQLAGRADPTDVPLEVVATFLADALLGVLTWWMDGDTPVDAEELDRIFHTLSTGGTRDAIGVEL
jgi:AcrR family transcriptional regulator